MERVLDNAMNDLTDFTIGLCGAVEVFNKAVMTEIVRYHLRIMLLMKGEYE